MADDVDSSDVRRGDVGRTLRSFLIADVRGYTRYTQERGDEEAARVAARFAELARSRIERHGGELLELRGDEALGVFASARDSLRAAVDLQRSFRERIDGEPALPLAVGIGLDAGEAVPVEGGFRGGALNLAARLCSLAGPGEILASETVVSLARRVEGIRFEERGVKRLKGLENPVKVIQVVSETRLPPVPASRWSSLGRFRRRHLTRPKAWAATGVALVAAVSAVLVILALGSPIANDNAPARVALAGPFNADDAGPTLPLFREGLIRVERTFDIETGVIPLDAFDTSPKALEQVKSAIESRDFDLIIFFGGPAALALAGELQNYPETHFVYLDAKFEEGSELEDLPNATAFFLLDGSGSYLAGYLAALVSKSGVVSAVGGIRAFDRLVDSFIEGAKAARPRINVRVGYSGDYGDQAACEKVANRQINEGSDVVFAAAGQCGLGALSAAGIRGVWGIGVDRDQSYLGPHILGSVVKRFDRVVERIVRQYLEGTLPPGGTVDLGLTEDAVALVGLNAMVSPDVRRKLAQQVPVVRKAEATPNP